MKYDFCQLTPEVREHLSGLSTSDNFGLAVEKAGRWNETKLDHMDPDTQQLFHKIQNRNLHKSLQGKQDMILKRLNIQGYRTGTFEVKQTWRMAIGLGNASAYNNGFTLHKVYGIPYIPAQALKGVFRGHVILEVFEGKEDGALKDQTFRYLFGANDPDRPNVQGLKGRIIFFDAYPNSQIKVVPDIVNAHFPRYYQQKSDERNPVAPGDWQNPNPVFFLSVKDTRFRIHYARPSSDDPPTSAAFGHKSVEQIILSGLPEALSNHGIGAKTAVGYGRMEIKK